MGTSFDDGLRGMARVLPRGVIRPWSLWLLSRLPAPRPRVPAGVTVEVRPLPGTSATVRIISPSSPSSSAAGRPMVLWIHGGGYVIGAAAQDDATCARIATTLGAVVFSVDYRLAPAHPHPAGLNDCAAAWSVMHAEAQALGLDPGRSIISGQSAGAGLAAALVLRLKDAGAPVPAKQVLIYPMLDDRTVTRTIDGAHHRIWDHQSNAIAWRAYLGRAPGDDGVSEYAAPARRRDLSGLPSTWMGVGSVDLFHDEDVDYARRLKAAGVDVELEVVAGAFHAFDVAVRRAAVSQRFVASYLAAMARGVLVSVTPPA